MSAELRWPMTEKMRSDLIARLTDNLQLLRVKIGMSQEELSKVIGISRQTYSTFETGRRAMSWQVYLAFVLFFEVNPATHDLLHHLGCFPEFLIHQGPAEGKRGRRQTEGTAHADIVEMLSEIDDQALRAIRTVLMLEYARCTNIPGEAVVKAFGGIPGALSGDVDVRDAVSRLRNTANTDDDQ